MLPRNGAADLLPRGPFAKPVLASARAAGRARRQPPAVSQPSGQGPVLVGIASAVPDLQLGAWSGRPVPVVETLPGLRIVKGAIGLRDKDLRGRVVAVVQVNSGAVRGAAAIDVHALAERVERAVGLDDRPLLGIRVVAGIDLDRGVVRGVRPADIHAQ